MYQSCSVNGLRAKVGRRDFPVALEVTKKKKKKKKKKKSHEPAVCDIWLHRIFNVPVPENRCDIKPNFAI